MNISMRNVKMSDLDGVAGIELECFPISEAAEKAVIKTRIAAFPENFFVAERDGVLIGFINGCTTNHSTIYDEMFHDVKHHIATGKTLAIFGLDVIPAYRNKGIAAQLMETFIENGKRTGKESIILTCKQHLVHYYEKFGFVNNGVSDSQHGGATWYDMTCTL